jgi:phospholipid/cholesterol/gamma-HCH transport system permease protein
MRDASVPYRMDNDKSAAQVHVRRKDRGVLLVEFAGNWLTRAGLPSVDPLKDEIANNGSVKSVEFDTRALGRWDSGLIIFALKCYELAREHKLQFRMESLPPGVAKFLDIYKSAPERKDPSRDAKPKTLLARVGDAGLRAWSSAQAMLAFLGESTLAFTKLVRGRAQYRWRDMLLVAQESGPQALGIVALINFIVGLILAFVGATQLKQFGASIYVADLVAIASVREMACIMTAIILSGRTGAAFAAHLGTMKVNQEIEALETFSISPMEFLVLPRIIALVVVMPFLCAFADLIAILGGLLISSTMLHIAPALYINRTIDAITLNSFLLGIFKGTYFGGVIALTGCLRGMQTGTNAAAVGHAATSAVVTGITAIVASDGVFAVLCNVLDI